MKGYKFLFDRDAAKSSGLFPTKRVWTLAKVGLPEDADDSEKGVGTPVHYRHIKRRRLKAGNPPFPEPNEEEGLS
jgi:hypothetical protein